MAKSIGTFRVGDYGTAIELTIQRGSSAVDVSGASTIQIKFRNPRKTITTKTASLSNDGTDGKIRYVLEDDVLDVAGGWEVWGYVVMSASEAWSTTKGEFKVEAA